MTSFSITSLYNYFQMAEGMCMQFHYDYESYMRCHETAVGLGRAGIEFLNAVSDPWEICERAAYLCREEHYPHYEDVLESMRK